MPGKTQMRPRPRPLGVKILDLAEAQPRHSKPQRLQLRHQHSLRAAIRRCDGGATQQALREGENVHDFTRAAGR
jgi:hypothetical protein